MRAQHPALVAAFSLAAACDSPPPGVVDGNGGNLGYEAQDVSQDLFVSYGDDPRIIELTVCARLGEPWDDAREDRVRERISVGRVDGEEAEDYDVSFSEDLVGTTCGNARTVRIELGAASTTYVVRVLIPSALSDRAAFGLTGEPTPAEEANSESWVFLRTNIHDCPHPTVVEPAPFRDIDPTSQDEVWSVWFSGIPTIAARWTNSSGTVLDASSDDPIVGASGASYRNHLVVVTAEQRARHPGAGVALVDSPGFQVNAGSFASNLSCAPSPFVLPLPPATATAPRRIVLSPFEAAVARAFPDR